MKHLISSLLITTMLAASVPAWADGTPVQIPPVSQPTVTPLNKGQLAPFTGVELSPEAVAQIVSQKDTSAQAMQLAVQHQVELDAAQAKYQIDSFTTTCTADKNDLQAQITDDQKQVTLLTNQLKAVSSPMFSTPVWIGIGFVGGVVVTTLISFAVVKATK